MKDRPPASPCIRICTLDGVGRCTGCGRTLEEISRWATMSVAEQWSVVDRLQRSRRDAKQAGAAQ
jgi:predicted Fe-S protein YdhL (DUF1289 family)